MLLADGSSEVTRVLDPDQLDRNELVTGPAGDGGHGGGGESTGDGLPGLALPIFPVPN